MTNKSQTSSSAMVMIMKRKNNQAQQASNYQGNNTFTQNQKQIISQFSMSIDSSNLNPQSHNPSSQGHYDDYQYKNLNSTTASCVSGIQKDLIVSQQQSSGTVSRAQKHKISSHTPHAQSKAGGIGVVENNTKNNRNNKEVHLQSASYYNDQQVVHDENKPTFYRSYNQQYGQNPNLTRNELNATVSTAGSNQANDINPKKRNISSKNQQILQQDLQQSLKVKQKIVFSQDDLLIEYVRRVKTLLKETNSVQQLPRKILESLNKFTGHKVWLFGNSSQGTTAGANGKPHLISQQGYYGSYGTKIFDADTYNQFIMRYNEMKKRKRALLITEEQKIQANGEQVDKVRAQAAQKLAILKSLSNDRIQRMLSQSYQQNPSEILGLLLNTSSASNLPQQKPMSPDCKGVLHQLEEHLQSQNCPNSKNINNANNPHVLSAYSISHGSIAPENTIAMTTHTPDDFLESTSPLLHSNTQDQQPAEQLASKNGNRQLASSQPRKQKQYLINKQSMISPMSPKVAPAVSSFVNQPGVQYQNNNYMVQQTGGNAFNRQGRRSTAEERQGDNATTAGKDPNFVLPQIKGGLGIQSGVKHTN